MTNDGWPVLGFAPGWYLCKCRGCDARFMGDKRSTTCPGCVIIALGAMQERLRPLVESTRWPDESGQTRDAAVKGNADVTPHQEKP